MSDTQYYLSNALDYLIVDGERTNYPNVTFGQSETFEFDIRETPTESTSTGGTYGGETGLTYGGSTGGTYAGGTTLTTPTERYNRFKEYQRYAGYASTGRTFGSVEFSENGDFSRASIDGIVISIRPGEGVQNARGVWGIIENIEDDTQIFGAIARIEMSVFVLADLREYDTESEVRTAFEADF